MGEQQSKQSSNNEINLVLRQLMRLERGLSLSSNIMQPWNLKSTLGGVNLPFCLIQASTSSTFTQMLWRALSAYRLKVNRELGLVYLSSYLGILYTSSSSKSLKYSFLSMKYLEGTSYNLISGAMEQVASCSKMSGSFLGYSIICGLNLRSLLQNLSTACVAILIVLSWMMSYYFYEYSLTLYYFGVYSQMFMPFFSTFLLLFIRKGIKARQAIPNIPSTVVAPFELLALLLQLEELELARLYELELF